MINLNIFKDNDKIEVRTLINKFNDSCIVSYNPKRDSYNMFVFTSSNKSSVNKVDITEKEVITYINNTFKPI